MGSDSDVGFKLTSRFLTQTNMSLVLPEAGTQFQVSSFMHYIFYMSVEALESSIFCVSSTQMLTESVKSCMP